MKGSLMVLGMFVAGCVAGRCWGPAEQTLGDLHRLSTYVLYALMLQVGMSIGGNGQFRQLLKHFSPRWLLLPLATVSGTLAFSALAALALSRWSVADVLAVGSGMGYYSLSSILIGQLKLEDLGTQLAAELSTIALLSNVFRELMALVGAPLFRRCFGTLAPIAVAGVTSVDVALPTIIRTCGQPMAAVAVFHGILIDVSVPFLVSFFCQF